MAARQQITRDWWDHRRHDFELFVSQLVIDEVSAGDPEAVRRRLEILEGIPLLEPQDNTGALVEALIRDVSLPDRAAADAVHIALSVVNGMDFLLTWNCTHIANAAFRPANRIRVQVARFPGAGDLHSRRTLDGVNMKLDPVLTEIRAAGGMASA